MFEWASVLELAKVLSDHAASGATPEAAWRSGASRAYFAAYNTVKDYIWEFEQYAPPKADSHRELHDFVSARTGHGKRHKQISTTLGRLRDLRNVADYDREPSFDQEKAAAAVVRATQVLSLVEDLRAKRSTTASR